MKKTLIIHPHELSRRWIDKMCALGVDTLGLHPVGGIKADETLQNLLDRLQDPEYRALLDYAREKGLSIVYELHALSYLMPRTLFDEHPDWFRIDAEGSRNSDMNLCVSNQEALDYVASRAAKLAENLYDSENRYFFWLDDAKDATCHCEKCRQLTGSDQQMIVLNRIQRELRKKDPTTKLAYLAYFSSMEPPRKVLPEEGIFVEYAPYERDFTKPAECMKPEAIENIKALQQFFGKDDARVLEYWYDNSLFSHYTMPPQPLYPNADNVKADLRFYNELGFDDIASFACYLGDEYVSLYGEPDLSSFK